MLPNRRLSTQYRITNVFHADIMKFQDNNNVLLYCYRNEDVNNKKKKEKNDYSGRHYPARVVVALVLSLAPCRSKRFGAPTGRVGVFA